MVGRGRKKSFIVHNNCALSRRRRRPRGRDVIPTNSGQPSSISCSFINPDGKSTNRPSIQSAIHLNLGHTRLIEINT